MAKADAMSAMAYRFKKEVMINNIYIKVVNVYIMPILLYGTKEWSQHRRRMEAKLEKALRLSSRFACGYTNNRIKIRALRQIS